jgi:pimeloyl-ACP methyl ester carboxylesterase
MARMEENQGATGDGFQPVTLSTERGEVETRFYEAHGAKAGLVLAGGVGGGFDTPAQGLYPRLAVELLPHGVSSLRVRYRNPVDLAEALHDVLAGIAFLGLRGVERVGLVGHSFGGAVMISAGALSTAVVAVVGLASQSHGTGAVARLSPRASLLLIHGTSDTILPPNCSLSIHERAGQPKALELIPGAGHVLDEEAERVHTRVHDWLLRSLFPHESSAGGGFPGRQA